MEASLLAPALVALRLDAYTNKVVAVICSLLEKGLAAEKAAQIKPGLKRAIWAERDFCMNLMGLNRDGRDTRPQADHPNADRAG